MSSQHWEPRARPPLSARTAAGLVADTLGPDPSTALSHCRAVDVDVFYFWAPDGRGGAVVGADRRPLFADAAVPAADHVEAFYEGKRSPSPGEGDPGRVT